MYGIQGKYALKPEKTHLNLFELFTHSIHLISDYYRVQDMYE